MKKEINEKEKEIEIENKLLLNIKEEMYSIQNENQRQINALKDELIKERKAFNDLERKFKKVQINYKENLDKKQMELNYGKMGNDMKLS